MSAVAGVRQLLLVALVLTGTATGAVAEAAEHRVAGVASFRLLSASDGPAWLEGGLGKLRFDETDEPFDLGVLLLEYRGRWSPTVEARLVAGVHDTVDGAVDPTEAFVAYRPVPRSAYRWQVKAGAFYPPLSLENVETGWRSPYTVSFSSVNTWLAEEVRILGLELEGARMGRHLNSAHDLAAQLGLFQGNDPLGALISWRGWSLQDRQTGLFERLPLADLPAFGPAGSFPPQGAFEEPFTEIDGRTGFYLGGQWDYRSRSRLRLHHYDNNGDPRVVEDGQWAWDTRFQHLGWQVRLPRESELIFQVLDGETVMEGFVGTLVRAEFRAASLLLTRAFGSHRGSVRYDDFEVVDADDTPDDPNAENGHAWTAAWFYEGEPVGEWGRWRVGIELLSITSSRPARVIFGQSEYRQEETVQLALEWRF